MNNFRGDLSEILVKITSLMLMPKMMITNEVRVSSPNISFPVSCLMGVSDLTSSLAAWQNHFRLRLNGNSDRDAGSAGCFRIFSLHAAYSGVLLTLCLSLLRDSALCYPFVHLIWTVLPFD